MITRRIRRSEQDLLKTLCEKETHWDKYFHQHKAWLNDALQDVNNRNRVVYGVFDPKNEEGDFINNKNLIGCIFLKHSKFDSCIEFKNVILPSYNFESNTKAQNAALLLIENAVRFCEVRNVLKIEIDLPHDEHHLISVFLSKNFKIVALRDKYSSGKPICTLERSIGEKYYGDPFDGMKMAYWLLRCYIPCEIIEVSDAFECNKISFTSKPITKVFSKKDSIGHSKLINGTMWVIEEEDSIEEINLIIEQTRSEPLSILLAVFDLPEEVKKKLNKNGIIYFDKTDLFEIAGGKKSSLSIPLDKQDIGGVITVLEQDQILDYAVKKDLTYYLLSGLHDGIDIDDDNEYIIAIYCANWYDKGPGIVGVAIINGFDRQYFHEILQAEIPENSALSKDDLSFYQTFSSNEKVGIVELQQFRLFETPLPIKHADWISTPEMKKYLLNQINENGCNSAYLDFGSTELLLGKYKESAYILAPEKNESDTVPVTKRKFRVGLSFTGSQRLFVQKVCKALTDKLGSHSVFYDFNYRAELAVKNLDILLGDIYRTQCDLIVPFFNKDYESRKWCKLEWDNIREILMESNEKHKLMAIKMEDVNIQGFRKQDGFIMYEGESPEEIADLIVERLSKMSI